MLVLHHATAVSPTAEAVSDSTEATEDIEGPTKWFRLISIRTVPVQRKSAAVLPEISKVAVTNCYPNRNYAYP